MEPHLKNFNYVICKKKRWKIKPKKKTKQKPFRKKSNKIYIIYIRIVFVLKDRSPQYLYIHIPPLIPWELMHSKFNPYLIYALKKMECKEQTLTHSKIPNNIYILVRVPGTTHAFEDYHNNVWLRHGWICMVCKICGDN